MHGVIRRMARAPEKTVGEATLFRERIMARPANEDASSRGEE